MMTKKEMIAEYQNQVKELDEVKEKFKIRKEAQAQLNCCLVVLAATGFAECYPKSFDKMKEITDEENKKTDSVEKDISRIEADLMAAAYWISMLDD